jgi:Na+-translocating ferredoxin:NAD+ oxidoreductase RnfG subunit
VWRSAFWRATHASPLLALLLHATLASAQSAPPAKVAKSVARIFGPAVQVDTIKVDTAVVLRVSKGGTLLGFAQVRNVKGKDQPITFLVAIDPANALKDVDVLVYREPQGGEVAYEPWRKQFRGKTTAAPLVVGRDIRNISGATISSHSVTLGVRKTLADLTAWHTAGKIR